MSFNPYASESASRIKVRSDPKEIEESKKIDHPLIEGKKLDMSPSEMNNFTKAMKHDEFQSIMSEYVEYRKVLSKTLKPALAMAVRGKVGFDKVGFDKVGFDNNDLYTEVLRPRGLR